MAGTMGQAELGAAYQQMVRMRMSGHRCLRCLIERRGMATLTSDLGAGGGSKAKLRSASAPSLVPALNSSHFMLNQYHAVNKELRRRKPRGYFTLDASLALANLQGS